MPTRRRTHLPNLLDRLLDDEAVVPALWQLEVTNVLLAVPLATLDRPPITAAETAGVELAIGG